MEEQETEKEDADGRGKKNKGAFDRSCNGGISGVGL